MIMDASAGGCWISAALAMLTMLDGHAYDYGWQYECYMLYNVATVTVVVYCIDHQETPTLLCLDRAKLLPQFHVAAFKF